MSVSSMPIIETIVHVYPRLISLHDVDPQNPNVPSMMRCSIEKFQDDGVYLLGKNTNENIKTNLKTDHLISL